MSDFNFNDENKITTDDNKNIDTLEDTSSVIKKKQLPLWIIYAFGAIVILIAIYFIYNVVFPNNSTAQKASSSPAKISFDLPATPDYKAQVRQTTNTGSQEKNKAIESQVLSLKNDIQEQTKYIAIALKKILDTQEAINNNQQNNINKIKEQLNQLASDLAKTHSSLDLLPKLESSLTSLNTEVAYMQAQRINLSDKLTLVAVTDHRAWLQDAKGNTLSVSEGSKIGLYGSVSQIDAQHNKVYTSSGFVFS
ncbi:hypothetical protein [Cysteiniphilum sp. JM-1]|uniref:hypothetical protein n=1 Tax=Cysteiniphilum sp. JM-1 TaxID=2610891 RepID=UPI001246BD19|nr:hypothetical protein [Cysteiniphilum sp. JM-1]